MAILGKARVAGAACRRRPIARSKGSARLVYNAAILRRADDFWNSRWGQGASCTTLHGLVRDVISILLRGVRAISGETKCRRSAFRILLVADCAAAHAGVYDRFWNGE